MLPTRGIPRVLPSPRPLTSPCGQLTAASSSHGLAPRRWPHNERRHYGSTPRRLNRSAVTRKQPSRISAHAWQPLAPAAAAPFRAFSVWGWMPGTKKPSAEAEAAAQPGPSAVAGVPRSAEPTQAASTPPPAEPVASPAPAASTSTEVPRSAEPTQAASTPPQAASTPPPAASTPPPAASTPLPAEPVASPAPTASASTEVDFNSIADSIHGTDILEMPERLGYLHAIGLDYGYGPTSIMQWVVEHVHIWGGLGWGGSIVVTALALRALMFYPQVRGLRFSATLQEMHKDPRYKEVAKLNDEALRERNSEKRQRGQYLQRLLKQQYGVDYSGILWSFLQVPFTFGLFRIVSGMVHIPMPALETAGFLWFRDLTATDPFFLLPAISTAFMVSAMLISSKYSPPSQKKMMKPMSYFIGVVGVFGTSFLSAAVNLMATAVGGATLLIALILDRPGVRRKLQLPTAPASLPTSTTYEAPRAASGLRERLKDNLDDMSKGLTERVANYTGQYSGDEMEKAERQRQSMLAKLEDMRKQQERADFMKKYKHRARRVDVPGS